MSSLSDRPLSSYFGSSVVLFALILPLIMADQQKKMFSLEKAVAGNKRALETPEKVRQNSEGFTDDANRASPATSHNKWTSSHVCISRD